MLPLEEAREYWVIKAVAMAKMLEDRMPKPKIIIDYKSLWMKVFRIMIDNNRNFKATGMYNIHMNLV